MSVLNQGRELRARGAFTGFEWALGIVILIEAGVFVLTPDARREFARTHMPQILRLLLGGGEMLGAILLMIPRTAVRGAGLLKNSSSFLLPYWLMLFTECRTSARSSSILRRHGPSHSEREGSIANER